MASAEAKALNEQLRALRDEIMGSGVRPTLEEQRRAVDSMGNYGTEPTGVKTTAVTAGSAPALLHQPESGGNGWVHLHCHGGGLAMGSAAAWSRWLGHLATKSGWAVLNLDFRRAPENPYPAGLQDTRAAFDWLVSQGYPAGHIGLGGDSAGAALALGTAQALRGSGVSPAGLVLLSPWVDFTLTNAALTSKTDSDVLTTLEALQMMREFYIGAQDAGDPAISPALGTLAGLPPMHIEASQEEILLDDATILADRARREGVDVDLKIWVTVPHVHQLFVGNLPEADESIALIAAWLQNRTNAPTGRPQVAG